MKNHQKNNIMEHIYTFFNKAQISLFIFLMHKVG